MGKVEGEREELRKVGRMKGGRRECRTDSMADFLRGRKGREEWKMREIVREMGSSQHRRTELNRMQWNGYE